MRRFLVVDDEVTWCAIMARALPAAIGSSIDVQTASSPDEALALKEEEFDVLLVDYFMPGMTGAEFLARVDEWWPGALRILVTGARTVDPLSDVMRRVRIDGYVRKSPRIDEFTRSLENVLLAAASRHASYRRPRASPAPGGDAEEGR